MVRDSGAEAYIIPTMYLCREAVEKIRPPKSYRIPEIDLRIRASRVRSEARILHETRKAGVRTPCVYDVNLKDCTLTMELVKGITVKKYLDEHPEDAGQVCRKIGRVLAKLHNAHICHGDLTTSNMILVDGSICLIDMSMGKTRAEMEDIGIDMYLLSRAFSSAHVGLNEAFDSLMDEYYANVDNPETIKKKLIDISNRGRYT